MAFADLVARVDRAAQDHLGGVLATYAPELGPAVEVPGMFDENYRLVDPGNAGVEQRGPAIFFRLEDLPIDPADDNPVITVAGVDYTVRERRTDGVAGGSILLLLHRAV